IVPVGIAGTHIALARGGKLTRSRLTVHFGEPFQVSDLGVTGKALRGAFNQELAKRLIEATREAGLDLRMPADS
ncbi:hypothetical protein ABTN76_19885, partial [Acinetobacter baumannii]